MGEEALAVWQGPTTSATCRENVFESKMEPYREYACALYKDEENPTITALLRDSQVTDTHQQLHTMARPHAPGMLLPTLPCM